MILNELLKRQTMIFELEIVVKLLEVAPGLINDETREWSRNSLNCVSEVIRYRH